MHRRIKKKLLKLLSIKNINCKSYLKLFLHPFQSNLNLIPKVILKSNYVEYIFYSI